MPRYLVMSNGSVYDDVTLPSDANGLLRACMAADERVGAPAATYRVVGRGDPEAEYDVYVVSPDVPPGVAPSLEDDCRYFGSVAVERSSTETPIPTHPTEVPRTVARPGPGLAPSRYGQQSLGGRAAGTERPLVVTSSTYPSLFVVLDTIAEGQGRRAGGYSVGPSFTADLDRADRAAAALSTEETSALTIGTADDRSRIAAVSDDAAALVRVVNAFAGW